MSPYRLILREGSISCKDFRLMKSAESALIGAVLARRTAVQWHARLASTL